MNTVSCVHVVPHINDEASGPSYSVPRLCQGLSAQGHAVSLLCLAANGPIEGVSLAVHRQWERLERFAVSPALAADLARRARVVDIVHNHSLWSMVNVASGWVVPGRRARLVCSPRGTLSAWALQHSRQAKRLLWPLQRRALSRADLLHATSEAEFEEIRALGLRAPVAIIPNGIDVAEAETQASSGPRTLLFLSRIHPKKGIDRLLLAWEALQSRHPEWQLILAGSGEPAHVAEVSALVARPSLQRVTLAGPVYGKDKAAAYSTASLFVLPTHSENFGMVVAEALAYGCPAVVSRGAPWSGLHDNECGWWIDNDVETLIAVLDQAMQRPAAELAAMGANGRDWMRREFGWSSVATRMGEAYRWTVDGGDVPGHVRLD